MPYKEFTIKTDDFSRRGKTIIQHKLRVVLKCYTVYDFSLKEDNTLVCKRCHRTKAVSTVKGSKTFSRKDPTELTGRYEIEKINEEESLLKIWVN